jgi:hypothetical protein
MMNEIKTFAKVSFSGKWFDNLVTMKYGKHIVRRVKERGTYDIKDVVEFMPSKTKSFLNNIKEPSDAIEYNNKLGYGCKVIRTNASEVEPWLLIIDYISNDQFEIGKIYKDSEIRPDLEHLDRSNQIITDVLNLNNTNILDNMYMSYVFTRNPYLNVANQYISLLTNGWVHIVEDIFKNDEKKTEKCLNQCFEFFTLVKNYFEKDISMTQIIDSICGTKDFEKYLTELNGNQSTSKILGALSTTFSKNLFFSDKFSRFAFALLAECIMRLCRIQLKLSKLNCNELIQKAIGLTIDTDLSTYKFDKAVCNKHCARMYKKRLTNCSPYAIVATLEFLERIHTNVSYSEILNDFINKKISMKNFLLRHLPNNDGTLTQIALYLQGIRYYRANMRQEIKFDNPEKIINDLVKEQVNLIKRTQLVREQAKTAYNIRLYKRLESFQSYYQYHNGLPKLFTYKEVNALNNKIGNKEDHLELMDTGLLKHHCCYQSCPLYLQNLATVKDKNNARSRHGLIKHMEPDRWIDNYIPGFHLTAKLLGAFPLKEFIKKMKDKFNNYPVNKVLHKNSTTFDQISDDMLEQLWMTVSDKNSHGNREQYYFSKASK